MAEFCRVLIYAERLGAGWGYEMVDTRELGAYMTVQRDSGYRARPGEIVSFSIVGWETEEARQRRLRLAAGRERGEVARTPVSPRASTPLDEGRPNRLACPRPDPNADSLAALDFLNLRREFWAAVRRGDFLMGGDEK